MSYPQEFINELSEDEDQLRKELRYSNHKRCLTMAKWCDESEQGFELLGNVEYDAKCRSHLYFVSNNRKKWRKRWLELAEEPTWEKFLQLIHKEA